MAEPQDPGFKAYESSNTENIGLDKKKKLRKNAGFVLFFLVLFFSGDSSCRFVVLVIMFVFFVAKINFLCSTRGHISRL